MEFADRSVDVFWGALDEDDEDKAVQVADDCLAELSRRLSDASTAAERELALDAQFQFLSTIAPEGLAFEPTIEQRALRLFADLQALRREAPPLQKACDVRSMAELIVFSAGNAAGTRRARAFIDEQIDAHDGETRAWIKSFRADFCAWTPREPLETQEHMLTELAVCEFDEIRADAQLRLRDLQSLGPTMPMPTFQAVGRNLEGVDVRFDDGRVTLVQIVNPSCGACAATPGILSQVRARHPADGLRILLVIVAPHLDEGTRKNYSAVAENVGAEIVFAKDRPQTDLPREGVVARLAIRGYPHFFVVDRAGKILTSGSHVGNDELPDVVEQAMTAER